MAPAPAVYRQPKYANQKEFVHKSGWFAPSLENVLCKMMYSTNVSVLTATTTGIYMFVHKRSPTKKYVAKSRTAYHDLVQMFHRLYDKKDERLTTLEREIRYNSPDAADWMFRIYALSSADLLEAEANKRILENNTLHPSGMNTELKFSSKESFFKFAEDYAQSLRESAKRNVNPIRVSGRWFKFMQTWSHARHVLAYLLLAFRSTCVSKNYTNPRILGQEYGNKFIDLERVTIVTTTNIISKLINISYIMEAI